MHQGNDCLSVDSASPETITSLAEQRGHLVLTLLEDTATIVIGSMATSQGGSAAPASAPTPAAPSTQFSFGNPFLHFQQWFQEASAAGAVAAEGQRITLATATPTGIPSARVVLLKAFDERGFVFFTNYTSRKVCESV